MSLQSTHGDGGLSDVLEFHEGDRGRALGVQSESAEAVVLLEHLSHFIFTGVRPDVGDEQSRARSIASWLGAQKTQVGHDLLLLESCHRSQSIWLDELRVTTRDQWQTLQRERIHPISS